MLQEVADLSAVFLKVLDGVSVLQELAGDLKSSIACAQSLKLEGIFHFALKQKSKASGRNIVQQPLSELEGGLLQCSVSDIQTALLSAAQKLKK